MTTAATQMIHTFAAMGQGHTLPFRSWEAQVFRFITPGHAGLHFTGLFYCVCLAVAHRGK